MNLVLHQLRADLRHLRYWLAAFWATLPLQILLPRLDRLPPDWRFAFEGAWVALQAILAVIVVARAVQADAFVGDTAFWKTRPLAPGRLWTAKSLLVGLALLLPFTAAEAIVWLGAGLSATQLAIALASLGVIVLPWVAIVLGVAGATRNPAQFLAVAAGLFGTAFLVLICFLFYADQSHLDAPPSLNAIRTAVLMALLWLGAWGGVAWLGAARRWRVRVRLAALALAMAGGALLPSVWRWSLFPEAVPPKAQVRVEVRDADAPPVQPPAEQELWSTFHVSGLPANTVAATMDLEAVFEPKAGKPIKFRQRLPWTAGWVTPLESSPQAADYYARIRAAFPPETLWFGQSSPSRNTMLPVDTHGVEISLGDQGKGRFSGALHLRLFEVLPVAELPLRPGAAGGTKDGNLVLQTVRIVPRGIEVTLEERSTGLLLQPMAHPFWAPSSGFVMVLHQPATHEAFLQDSGFFTAVGYDLYAGQLVQRQRLLFRFSRLRARLAGVEPAAWIKGARLHVFIARPTGQATRRFDVADFHLNLGGDRERENDRRTRLADLEKLTLAPNAGAEEAARYVDRLIALGGELRGGNDWRRLRDKLMAVGTNHLAALIRRWPLPREIRYSVGRPVLSRLAAREHLPTLRAALRRDPGLVWLFQQRHWETDAQPVLRELLPDLRVPLPAEAFALAAEGAPASLYPLLARRFVLLESGHELVLPVLEKLDGFDVDAAVRAAWKRAGVGLADRAGLAIAAARLGLPGALDAAIEAIDRGQLSPAGSRWAHELREITGYAESPDEGPATFRTWLLANWGRFQYQPAEHAYRLPQ